MLSSSEMPPASELADKTDAELVSIVLSDKGSDAAERAWTVLQRRYENLMQTLARTDVLILDDWGLASRGDRERRDLLEVIEERTGRRATMVTSQLPVDPCHEIVGDATFGYAILDRLVHHAHWITRTGGSLRRRTADVSSPTTKDLPSPALLSSRGVRHY